MSQSPLLETTEADHTNASQTDRHLQTHTEHCRAEVQCTECHLHSCFTCRAGKLPSLDTRVFWFNSEITPSQNRSSTRTLLSSSFVLTSLSTGSQAWTTVDMCTHTRVCDLHANHRSRRSDSSRVCQADSIGMVKQKKIRTDSFRPKQKKCRDWSARPGNLLLAGKHRPIYVKSPVSQSSLDENYKTEWHNIYLVLQAFD